MKASGVLKQLVPTMLWTCSVLCVRWFLMTLHAAAALKD